MDVRQKRQVPCNEWDFGGAVRLIESFRVEAPSPGKWDDSPQSFPVTTAKSVAPEYDQFTHSPDIGDRFRISFFDYLSSIHYE